MRIEPGNSESDLISKVRRADVDALADWDPGAKQITEPRIAVCLGQGLQTRLTYCF